ncbi:MAG: DUF1822 family protein [Leptolyngbyaceae cyanobacterium bins.59]|nr:DUF1822 family protein [Leptolyngbyaceae cyanobacterium bins.59]
MTLSIPITPLARQTARTFAEQQPDTEKAKQVYLNTLAVWIVNDYLQMLGTETDLKGSDSWNPIARLCADIADLKLWGSNRIECRPVLPGQRVCTIPPETWEDRLAYLAVQIAETEREGILLGFIPEARQSTILLHEFQSLDQLLERLHAIPVVIRLSQWLHGAFESGWLAIEHLISYRETPELAFRTRQVRGRDPEVPENVSVLVKQLYREHCLSENNLDSIALPSDPQQALIQLLQTATNEELRWTAAEILWTIDPSNPAAGVRRMTDLGLQLAGQAVALMVAVLPQRGQRLTVLQRVYPMGQQPWLPPGLQLSIFDETGKLFRQAQARQRDNYIQLKISGEVGEEFTVRVELDGVSITESFMI